MPFTVSLSGSVTLSDAPAMVELLLSAGALQLEAEAGLQLQGFAGQLGVTMTAGGVFVSMPAGAPLEGSLTLSAVTGPGQPIPAIQLQGASGGVLSVAYSTDEGPQVQPLIPYVTLELTGYC